MKNTPISHESFPQYIEKLEARGTKLNGQKIGRVLASVLNMMLCSVLTVLIVCVVYCTEDPEKMPIPEAFTHIPGFFRKASQWAMDLLPAGLDKWWICMIALLCAIPVSGLVSGLIFRFIPFKGKAVKAEEGQTPEERTDHALELVEKLRKKYNEVTEYMTFGTFVAPVVALLAVLGLPITSVILANPGAQWYMILAEVLVMLIQMVFLLLIALCVLCYGMFWVAVAQEWVTSLFYLGSNFKKEEAKLKDYKALLQEEEKQRQEEAKQARIREVAAVQDQAVDALIAGNIAQALKLIASVEDEAEYPDEIKWLAKLVGKKPDINTWCELAEMDVEKPELPKLQEFKRQLQKESYQMLESLAEEEYARGKQLMANKEFLRAIPHMQVAKIVDYRDGVALHALATMTGKRNPKDYKWIYDDLQHGIDKGLEDAEMEVICLTAMDEIKEAWELERWAAEKHRQEVAQAAAAAKAAEEAYWLEVGRQANMSCPYEVNGYCCRYTTLDNFPHKCYYIDNRRDMYLCSDRK